MDAGLVFWRRGEVEEWVGMRFETKGRRGERRKNNRVEAPGTGMGLERVQCPARKV